MNDEKEEAAIRAHLAERIAEVCTTGRLTIVSGNATGPHRGYGPAINRNGSAPQFGKAGS